MAAVRDPANVDWIAAWQLEDNDVTLRSKILMLVIVGTWPLGCSSTPTTDGTTNVDDVQVVVDEDVIVTDPGSDFDDAPRVQFDLANRMVIDNTINGENEVHVYNLGELSMGDAIEVIAIDKNAEGFDPMIAMFDADGYRVFWNDDVNPETGNFNAFFTGSIRHDSPSYYLAVASSGFSMTTGDYRITVDLTPQLALAPVKEQNFVLQWEAADDVSVSGVSYGDLDEVLAETLSSSFDGRTQEFRDSVLGIVQKDFAAYGVNVLSSDDELPLGSYSEIFFGNETAFELSSAKIFGSADSIDFYNANNQDKAIVFLGAFAGLSSSFDAVVQAVANVTSHEIGHTLGLMHTVDSTTIMDTAGADTTLLNDQIFGTAPMFDFPIGIQNADQLLEETVGRVAASDDAGVSLRCGTCGATLLKVHGKTID